MFLYIFEIYKFIVQFDPALVDTSKPRITVLYNGKSLTDTTTVRSPDPSISILVLDNSPIHTVTVNGAEVLRSPDSLNALPTYIAPLSLEHPYNAITIEVTDINNNQSTARYDSIRFNRLPVITGDFTDNNGAAGNQFIWKTRVTDPDGDPLTVTAFVNHQIIPMSPDGIITWKSTIKDTGLHTVSIVAYDSYETIDTSFYLSVSKQSDAGVAVRWLTDTADIPSTLVVGEDSLKLILRPNRLSNIRPFHFSVKLTDNGKVLLDGNDSSLLWIPDSNDIGIHTLQFTITDKAGNSTIFTDAISVLRAVPAIVQFSGAASGGNESSASAAFQIVLSKALKTPVTIDYSIDEVATTAHVTEFKLPDVPTVAFAPGEISKSIPLIIYDNSIAEMDRKVAVKLTGTTPNAVFGSQITSTYTILDDDYVNFSFATSQGMGSNRGWGIDTAHIEVTLSGAFPIPVTLNCMVEDEYTTAGHNDFSLPASSESITFSAGATKDTIPLLILPSRMGGIGFPTGQPQNQNRIVALRLGSSDQSVRPGNITLYKYTIGEATAFYIDSNLLSVRESDSIKIISMRRKDTIFSSVSVYFEVNKELTTAIEDVDFKLATSSPITYESTYLRSKQIKVRVFDDKIRESSKKVVIDITNVTPPGYLASNPRVEITIRDDD